MSEVYKRLNRSIGYYLILLGLTSGMRFGEMVGLTRDDFDFKRNVIKVTEAWDYKTDRNFVRKMPTEQCSFMRTWQVR